MPYIKEQRRRFLLYPDADMPENCGELNYKITMEALAYLEKKGQSYQTYNDIIGALECCKLEMYRRSIGPYEDTKIAENGDVY